MAQAVNGEDVRVDVTSIEKQLADLWRAEKSERDDVMTKAALWNVVAHTSTGEAHTHASEVLARASASVPQRTIVIRADPRGDNDTIASWISANCHLIGGGRQVCSEEVSIVATGEHIDHVPPLVNALLLPDMPVALWWVGDLPDDHLDYAAALLDPVDRLIVDSSNFDSADDLERVSRVAERTTTAPADLNWARLAATATLFDPEPMRGRLQSIERVRVTCGGNGSFGHTSSALLYAAWISVQSGTTPRFETAREGDSAGIRSVELHFHDGNKAVIRREREGGAVVAHAEGSATKLDCVARTLADATEDLIVRLLKRPEADRVYLKALKTAQALAK
jgi:glucose-6-phosphate dehydrogenase assembly protein OpcA